MKKLILSSIIFIMGLSANAFDWSSLSGLLYSPYQQYPQYPQTSQYNAYQQPYSAPLVTQTQPDQNGNYTVTETYPQSYTYQPQCVNPYNRPYGYRRNNPFNVINSAVPGVTVNAGTGQIMRNVGQSMMYSMLRGY